MRARASVLGMGSNARRKLEKAVDSDRLRVITRDVDDDRHHGLVLAVGEEWLLLARTADGGHAEGFLALRVDDVDKVWKDAEFAQRIAEDQPDWPPAPPEGLDLDSTAGLLGSLPPGTVVGIHRERKRPDAFWVGLPDGVLDDRFYLRQVDAQGNWDDEPTGYKLKQVTAVEWGGRYLQALATTLPEDISPPR